MFQFVFNHTDGTKRITFTFQNFLPSIDIEYPMGNLSNDFIVWINASSVIESVPKLPLSNNSVFFQYKDV